MAQKNPYAELVDPWAETKEPKNPWPEDDQAENKRITKQIGHLMSSLVLYVNLTKQSSRFDETFPGLKNIIKESESARIRAIGIMESLLKEWKK